MELERVSQSIIMSLNQTRVSNMAAAGNLALLEEMSGNITNSSIPQLNDLGEHLPLTCFHPLSVHVLLSFYLPPLCQQIVWCHWAVFCHTGSGWVGGMWSARKKSLKILRPWLQLFYSCTWPSYQADLPSCWNGSSNYVKRLFSQRALSMTKTWTQDFILSHDQYNSQ